MKFLQIVFLSLFLSLGIQKSNAQVYRFKARSVSVVDKDAKGKWGKWSDFKKAELIITLDGKKDRIIVNTRELQLFKIITYGEKITTPTDDTVPFICVNNNGEPCTILIITRKNQNNRMQFYINYNDAKIVYNIESLN
jgi:hypothetical protein